MRINKLPAGEIARRVVQAKESTRAAKTARKTAIATERRIKEEYGVRQKKLVNLEHGKHIFVFNHLQKNHVVYSLTRAMENNAAMAQIPFNGKKSKPAALRKDLWNPFAHIKFPNGAGKIGLSVFQKLREYRRRHELEWGDEIRLDEKGKVRTVRERSKAICDQKANSVADMATVLNRLATKTEKTEPVAKKLNIGLVGEGSGTEVKISWGDLLDAEFASNWGEHVEHSLMRSPKQVKPGSQRRKAERNALQLFKGERAALQALAEAELERNAAKDAVDAEWRSKMSPEEREELALEKVTKVNQIMKDFKRRERNSTVRDFERADEAARAIRLQQLRVRLAAKGLQSKGVPEALSPAKSRVRRKRRPKSSSPRVVVFTPEEIQAQVSKAEKDRVARAAYEKRQAEVAAKKASDPAWYEQVKAEGLKRKMEKNLL